MGLFIIAFLTFVGWNYFFHACAARAAKSAKLIGGRPVTVSTSSLGRDPLPLATVDVLLMTPSS